MPRTRRSFTAEFKAKVVLEIISGSKSAAQAFENGLEPDPQQARIQELERLAGRLSLELEIAKKALTLLPHKSEPNGN